MRRAALATLVTWFVVLGFAASGILAADAANPSFAAVVNPLSQLPAGGGLSGMQCPSPGYCVAVGVDANSEPLVLAGDPSTWGTAQAQEITLGATLSGGSLDSIACTSSTSCVAVGYDGKGDPLVLAGNPSTWGAAQAKVITLGAAFGYRGSLFSIACDASSVLCVAVGADGHKQPLVLAGDPSSWGVAQANEITLGPSFGSRGSLASVDCTSSTSCVAVGGEGEGHSLTLAGDPSTWGAAQAQEITDNFGGVLLSVDCTSSSSCVAVGEDSTNKPLTLAGDPSTWADAQTQEIALDASFGASGFLSSVDCASSTSCVAVGGDGNGQPLTLAGDPSTFGAAQAEEITLDASFGTGGLHHHLSSVICTASTACLAVGRAADKQPLQLAGDPATWGVAQAEQVTLRGVAVGPHASSGLTCVSATSCVELGSYGRGTYLLQGDPATWDQASTTVLANAAGLTAVTCTAATYCVAVGRNGKNEPLVLAGNPSTWGTAHGRSIPLGKAFGRGGTLASVSCPSRTRCVAVGHDVRGEPLVIAGNPSAWTAANAKEIEMTGYGETGGAFYSVACTSRTRCVAVGTAGNPPRIESEFKPALLVLAGQPATWGAAQAKAIKLGKTFGSYGSLSSVACLSSTYCVSVGESGRNRKPLVLVGRPSTWNATSPFSLPVPSPTASTVGGFSVNGRPGTGYLTSVSCRSTTYCAAVGGDNRAAPLYIAGNPTQWHGQPLVRPAKSGASFQTATVTSSFCTRLVCFAGGSSNGGDFVATVK